LRNNCCNDSCRCRECCPPPQPVCLLQSLVRNFCRFLNYFYNRFIAGVVPYLNIELDSAGDTVSSKASVIEEYAFFNSGNDPVWVHFYNSDEAVDIPNDTPQRTVMIPFQGGENISDLRLTFETGIYIRATLSIDPTVESDPPADSVAINIGYKLL